MLSAVNKEKRFLFAQEHSAFTSADWQNVLFTDESTFTTRWDQRQRIWRADDTRFKPGNLQRIASSGRCAVSVWGSLTKDGLGPLARIEGRFNSAAELVESVLLPPIVPLAQVPGVKGAGDRNHTAHKGPFR
ncbi:hypothetical protein HPB47_026882 [Ixodes persulcatus]|uniref:Uncharacterized protein n=1 Tax=Ixodes persulcatus TaxID=34615 RepID=A0AC60PXV1_IXOPE|nr:hypothetical protein HPB47_026882 [Ixodes persulcatus]